MSTDDKVLLVALTAIRRRKVVRAAEKPGEKDKTVAEDISAGRTFEATEAEANQLTRGERPAARRAGLDEQAHAKGGEAVKNADGLDDLTVKELRERAKERGVVLPAEANRKDEIIAELRKPPVG